MELVQFFTILLAAFGLVGVGWLILGSLVLPGTCPAQMVIDAQGDGGGLEQTVRALLWLRRSGFWRGSVVIRDCGLTEAGGALARALAEQSGVCFTGDAPDRIGPA